MCVRRSRIVIWRFAGAITLPVSLLLATAVRASTVLTSNKGFEAWGEIFGDEVMAAALIDRLVHHSHLVNIRDNSYRMRRHADLAQLIQPTHETPAPRTRRPPRQEAGLP